ncbi:hypothetical protein M885DRAFT_564710 [Pelagophyceae sp. CCMP2097]|nr:hypothetical protein M885DRAFT_564710 [Pelagophyceae sp. CCMP2097]
MAFVPAEVRAYSDLDKTRCGGCGTSLLVVKGKVHTVFDKYKVATRICADCKEDGFEEWVEPESDESIKARRKEEKRKRKENDKKKGWFGM